MSSSTKRGVAPVAPGVGLKLPPSSSKPMSNGTGPPPPLSYQSEPKDDVNMNEVIEENVELEVILPNGKSYTEIFDHSIPMMDLLIQLAVKNKVSPSNYTIVAISEKTRRTIDYKANQTIGSLETQTIRLVPKKGEVDRISGKPVNGKAQPFEMTHRFTVNLPRNQKMVSRISQAMPLDQLFLKVCQEKNLNPNHYAFQHAVQPNLQLDLTRMTVGDLKCNEINFISSAMLDSARSMPDLSRSESAKLPRDQTPSYMPGLKEPKKKRSLLSFLKKDKKFKLNETEPRLDAQLYATSSSKSSGHKQLTPPTERRNIPDTTQGVRPKSMFVTSKPSELENGHATAVKENSLPKVPPRTGKKRQAPPPPSQNLTIQAPSATSPPKSVEVVIKDQMPESQQKTQKSTENKNGPDVVTQRLHSRNSSDSSGYHELTLSGAESPDAGRVKSTFQTSIDTTSIESVDNNNDSGITDITPSHNALTNQMSAGDSQTLPLNRGAISKPPRQRSHSLERKDNNLTTAPQVVKPSTKKKRAPAPPQPTASITPLPTHEEAPSMVETSQVTEEPISNKAEEEQDIQLSMSIMDDVVDKFDNELDKSLDDSQQYNGNESQEMMTERASLCSEDIDNIIDVQPKSQRPCSFVAPPPPLEPPPDLIPDSEKEFADKGVVVNEDNASLPPESLKGSPTIMHSRLSSQSSINSVNTIEDVGLDFEQTIALGEEYLQSNEKEPEYRNEMAMFVEKMAELTVGSYMEQSGSATPSIQGTEGSEAGSIANQNPEQIQATNQTGDTDTESLTESEVSTQSDLDKWEKERQARLSAIFSNNYDSWEDPSPPRQRADSKKIGHAINQKLLSPDADSPIVFDYPPPPEFQNDPLATELRYDEPSKTSSPNLQFVSTSRISTPDYKKTESNTQPEPEEEEEEEEWSETIEEVYHFGPKSSYTFGGAYKKTPDLETKKDSDSPKSQSNKPHSSVTFYKESKPVETELKTAPREKEEFVLTTSDLANVNFVASPPLKNRNSKASYLNGKPTGYVETPYSDRNYSYKNESKPQVSEVSFTPSYTNETESVEQKSNPYGLPSMREAPRSSSPINTYTSSTSLNMAHRELTPTGWVTKSQPKETMSSTPTYDSSTEENLSPRYQVAPTTYSRLLTPSGWQAAPSNNDDNVSISPSVSSSVSDFNDDSKAAQYVELEDQLKQWKEQLEINQNIVASQQFAPENQSLQAQMQSQIEMQKQMMEQLQKSMSALTKDAPVVKPPPSPPSPPPQPAVQLKKVTKTNRPPVKRFEPKLDPREELMIAIRTFGGRNGLESVPVRKTNWK